MLRWLSCHLTLTAYKLDHGGQSVDHRYVFGFRMARQEALIPFRRAIERSIIIATRQLPNMATNGMADMLLKAIQPESTRPLLTNTPPTTNPINPNMAVQNMNSEKTVSSRDCSHHCQHLLIIFINILTEPRRRHWCLCCLWIFQGSCVSRNLIILCTCNSILSILTLSPIYAILVTSQVRPPANFIVRSHLHL